MDRKAREQCGLEGKEAKVIFPFPPQQSRVESFRVAAGGALGDCSSSLYCWENWGISTLGSREETKVTTDVSTNPAEKRAERSHGAAGVSRASEGTGGEPADPTYLLPERVVWSLADVIIDFLFTYHRESLERAGH